MKVLGDIRGRGLGVGDRYLTTDAVGLMLGVRKAVASKAVRSLAEKQILISRPGAGTFIGPGLGKDNSSEVQTIYILLPAGDASGAHWAFQPYIMGIRSALPEVNVQFTFVPQNDPLPYVRELINAQRASGHFAGVVAVSCPPEVYRYLSELGIPAVVSGSLYSSKLPLSSVDIDCRHSGRLLTEYLVDRGHRRMALLLTGVGRPGDNLFIDGISDALTAAGLPPNTLVQRSVRDDLVALQATVEDLLEGPDRPTAAITRGSPQAATVVSAVSELGMIVPDDLEVVFDHTDETTHLIDTSLYPRVETKSSFQEHAEMIGRILKELRNDPSCPQHLILPVEFHEGRRNPQKTAGN